MPLTKRSEPAAEPQDAPFWKRKTLEEMTPAEWESLCDGCARCCLIKLEEESDGRIFYTRLGCTLLDARECRCRDYPNRAERVADCVTLTPHEVRTIGWLPPTCGYRLVAEGKDLAWWHPLVSGRAETVHQAGISVRGKVLASEDDLPAEVWGDHIVNWPLKWPKGARKQG